jgi:hypothetical protein
MWEYQSPYPIKIDTVRFVNQASGTLNVWSKDIDLWISNDDESSIAQKEKIIVGHFTALGEDCGETIYHIENPQYAKVFGLTVLSSYGAGVGAKHIEMDGYYGSSLAPNIKGYIYIISDENGNTPDIATSIYTGAEFEALLPAGFTKYALIGEFETDANANVVFNYPEMDLAKAFITRDLVNEDRLTEVHNEIDYRIDSIPGVSGYEQTIQDLRDQFGAADDALDDKIDAEIERATLAEEAIGGEITALQSTLQSLIDTSISNIFPVGSLYIGTQSTCPLASIISGSTWELVAQDKALWGGDGTNANTTIEPGVPNITGSFSTSQNGLQTNAVDGSALYGVQGTGNTHATSTTGNACKSINFDASRSNSIYGNSDTVQPPAYRANIWRRTA